MTFFIHFMLTLFALRICLQHELHKTMRAWMKKEILKLLKKQKALVADYVVKVIKEHEGPLRMLELLQPFVEDDTEMVVQILWRTLVILVKILETGKKMTNS